MYLYRPSYHIVFVACSTNEGEGQVNLTWSDVLGQWAMYGGAVSDVCKAIGRLSKPEKHWQDYYANCLYGCDW